MPKHSTGRRDPAGKSETKDVRKRNDVVESLRSSADKAAERRIEEADRKK